MEIKLNKILMKNFKGIKELEINFKGKDTNIFADNAVGKTTVFDAFLWVFFDKDSTGRKQFNVKTLDKNNNPVLKYFVNQDGIVQKEVLVYTEIISLPNKLEYMEAKDLLDVTGGKLKLYYNNGTVEEIANHCNVSLSLLSHIFKKEMNISPYKYALKKRLINARRKINAGELSTSVAVECGWNDYSGFYKQYIKTFGVPPSSKK